MSPLRLLTGTLRNLKVSVREIKGHISPRPPVCRDVAFRDLQADGCCPAAVPWVSPSRSPCPPALSHPSHHANVNTETLEPTAGGSSRQSLGLKSSPLPEGDRLT